MLLPDIDFRMSYDSGMAGVDVVQDFYVPALSAGQQYDRLAGFFSSTSLAIAARGIAGLMENGGHMRLATSPRIRPDDLPILTEAGGDLGEAELSSMLSRGLAEDLSDEIARDHVRALAWLLSEGRLEIRIVTPSGLEGPRGLFHMKIGVIRDAEDNAVAFDGSVNESATGWYHNIEHFSVYKSWAGEQKRVDDVMDTFQRYWDDPGPRVRVWKLPEAVAESLLELRPRDPEELAMTLEALHSVEADHRPHRTAPDEPELGLPPLRGYQEEAISQWEANERFGILEMATGTGKTITALAAAQRASEHLPRLLVVVAAPQNHLADQWAEDVKRAFPTSRLIQAGSSHSNWRASLLDVVGGLVAGGVGDAAVCVAVHQTAGLDRFLDVLAKAQAAGCSLMLIADEAHELGAPQMRRALAESYGFRLGLSATPARFYDDEGTAVLDDYFHGVVYRFGLKEALAAGCLTPYEYHPRFVQLTDEEAEEYQRLTSKAAKAAAISRNSNDPDAAHAEERFLQMRAVVVKKAEAKLQTLDDILRALKGDMGYSLVYCLDGDQMSLVSDVLDKHSIVYRHFTGAESRSERASILNSFESGQTKTLVAMKCLDQGVDVPAAKTGIILASSTNPRESIQRRGRLLRRHKSKKRAHIHDVIVSPELGRMMDPDIRKLELRLFRKEIARLKEFASAAINASECYSVLAAELDRLEGES